MLRRRELFKLLSGFIAQREVAGDVLGVLLIKVPRVREFNLLFGYLAGERMLHGCHRLIESAVRAVDVVLKVGEAEFAVLLPGLMSRNHALLAANRLVRAFQGPVPTNSGRVQVAAVIGVTVCPDHGTSPEDLCRRADVACSLAARTIERFAIYTPAEGEGEIPYEDLREALDRGRLELYLQPIWDLRTGLVVGAESLARWKSPRLGWVSPTAFVAVAEQTGLITELTRWSLNATLRHGAVARLAERNMRLSVNLSPVVFLEPGFTEHVLSLLRLWEVPGNAITFEVTENAIMENLGRSASVLERLSAEGLNIAIDDFGTGYSSFSYLKQFRASELKIDQSFVCDVLADTRSAQLVRSMIDLAHNLDMKVCAEGVEDQPTLDALTNMDCDFAQGFHLRRPQPADDFVSSLPALA